MTMRLSPRTVLVLTNAVHALPTEYRPHGVVLNLLGLSGRGEVSAVAGNVAAASAHNAPLTSGEYYVYMVTSICLVLLGGVFAGLTLGLMGQDEVYLKVIAASGTPNEKRCARKVLDLIGNGKHWLLVTLLLSNVITNETLPVILDRFLGGGFAAVFSATVAIVIFGEIIPQSICVRYGLELGAFFAPYVLALMWIMYPIAYPIAMLLDWILGQDHGTLYKKSGLKTLVNLHHTMGAERLNADEVTIISSVLDLKAKPVREIMTPIAKVFTLPSNEVLDEKMVETIFNAGYSRIPIHLPGEPHNFVGMLLVRILISYDPEDALPVSSFPLATLPETPKDTSCLNILNYFQEGKSHMVVVSRTPGSDTGAIGVVTLEDVIEELIGEEIVDESDVYIDENKTIMRPLPGPLGKRNVTSYLHDLYKTSRSSIDAGEGNAQTGDGAPAGAREGHSDSRPCCPAYISKSSFSRSNSRANSIKDAPHASHPKHLPNGDHINSKTAHGIKPSNLAVDPLSTKNTHITIKKQPLLTTEGPSKPREGGALLAGDGSHRTSYGSTPEPLVEPVAEVHTNEASAFVQGLVNNAVRGDLRAEQELASGSDRKTSSNGTSRASGEIDDLTAKKLRYMNNNYGIPIPREERSSFSGTEYAPGSGAIIENSIVSSRGVAKTIIEAGAEDQVSVISDAPTNMSLKSGKKGRASSFWGGIP